MREIIICLLSFTYLSCGNGNNKNDTDVTYPMPQEHQPVEVTQEGKVEVTDDPDEGEDNEPYIADQDLSPTSSQRMQELLTNSNFLRNNGKAKRKKIAKQLNEDGFRKSNGEKFRVRDIPK